MENGGRSLPDQALFAGVAGLFCFGEGVGSPIGIEDNKNFPRGGSKAEWSNRRLH